MNNQANSAFQITYGEFSITVASSGVRTAFIRKDITRYYTRSRTPGLLGVNPDNEISYQFVIESEVRGTTTQAAYSGDQETVDAIFISFDNAYNQYKNT